MNTKITRKQKKFVGMLNSSLQMEAGGLPRFNVESLKPPDAELTQLKQLISTKKLLLGVYSESVNSSSLKLLLHGTAE